MDLYTPRVKASFDRSVELLRMEAAAEEKKGCFRYSDHLNVLIITARMEIFVVGSFLPARAI